MENKTYFTDVNKGTKQARYMHYDLNNYYHGRDIYSAYKNPSSYKVRTFNAIRERATETPGYNHDLHIVGASSHFYSTIYTYTENGVTYIVKDTHANTYRTIKTA